MTNETRRAALISAYARAMLRGDRRSAKKIWTHLHRATCEALKS